MFLCARRLPIPLVLLLTSLAVHGSPAPATPQAVIEDSAKALLQAFDSGAFRGADAARLRLLVGELLDAHVDFPSVARLVLGKHWRRATDTDRDKFVAEFRTLIIRTYTRTLAQAERPSLRVLGEEWGRDGRLARVRAELSTGDGSPPLELLYRLRRTDAGWKIIDVNINGFSLVTNYRRYFQRELRTRELPQLIDRLGAFNRQEDGFEEFAG